MAKLKNADLLSCAECGLIVTVDQACGCVACDIICCGQAMGRGKLAAGKARKKMAAAANPAPQKQVAKKAAVKAEKPAPKAKATKAAADPKPKAKKPGTKA